MYLFSQYTLGSELQPAGTLHRATIKRQHLIGGRAACLLRRPGVCAQPVSL